MAMVSDCLPVVVGAVSIEPAAVREHGLRGEYYHQRGSKGQNAHGEAQTCPECSRLRTAPVSMSLFLRDIPYLQMPWASLALHPMPLQQVAQSQAKSHPIPALPRGYDQCRLRTRSRQQHRISQRRQPDGAVTRD
jgi:hypothetical protein